MDKLEVLSSTPDSPTGKVKRTNPKKPPGCADLDKKSERGTFILGVWSDISRLGHSLRGTKSPFWLAWVKDTHKVCCESIQRVMSSTGLGQGTVKLFYPISFFAVQLVHKIPKIREASYRYMKESRHLKMFFLFTDVAQVEALVGKEALLDKPNGTEGMFLRFLCSPKFPVLVQYDVRQQFLRIKFEYVLNKLYEDAEEVFVGPANLGGWAARLLKAEASDDTPQENAPPSKYILRDRCGSHLIGKTIKVYWPTHDDYLIGFVRRMVSPQEDAEGTHLVYYPYIKDCVGEILMISPKGPICEFCIIDDTIPIKTFREKK